MQSAFVDKRCYTWREEMEKQLKGALISVECREIEGEVCSRGQAVWGHHDRAKTLVCRPDPRCLPHYSFGFCSRVCLCVCDWMLDLILTFLMCSLCLLHESKRPLPYTKIWGVWQADFELRQPQFHLLVICVFFLFCAVSRLWSFLPLLLLILKISQVRERLAPRQVVCQNINLD